MKRSIEFFQADGGQQLSMSRLLMFGSFIITSMIMVKLTPGDMNEGYFSMYLGAYAGTYLTGKWIDANAKAKKDEPG